MPVYFYPPKKRNLPANRIGFKLAFNYLKAKRLIEVYF
jgi:hypothetical protein